MKTTITVNGQARALDLDTRTTLLDALREHLDLKGSKKGCDHGQCGACTVLANGVRINACLSLAVMHDGDEITTIEGIGTEENLHPLQVAFLTEDGAFKSALTWLGMPWRISASAATAEQICPGVQ